MSGFVLLLALASFVTINKGLQNAVIDTNASQVEWTGKKLTGEHYGFINISKGNLEFKGSKLSGGSFELDMNSITCTDIKDEKSNTRFVNHLKSDDFFSVDLFPVSKFEITKAVHKGSENYEITGNLTIKEITHPLTFSAVVSNKEGKVTATANLKFDRSKYNVKFGSKSFFENIGDKLVYDDVEMKVKLVSSLSLADSQ
jgi:polyisoprenoid-binding protein YceI